MVNYFLISVSTRENLELCKKYNLAGFTNSVNGVWTFYEINEGDFISFLYAAKVHNLYKVERKAAFKNAEKLPPWKPVTFSISKRTYYFPFRLFLKPIRILEESLVRPEFAYIAENLLIRGGYRKTHFQADQTTLQNVSQMGRLFSENGSVEKLQIDEETFIPKFTTSKKIVEPPYVFPFREIILQSLIRQYLNNSKKLEGFLNEISINDIETSKLEVLSEKAIPQGHIDLLIKEAVPLGKSKIIIIEVKVGKAGKRDFQQLYHYREEFGPECIGAILIGKDFSKKAVKSFDGTIIPVTYNLQTNLEKPITFEEMLNSLELTRFKL